MDEKKWSEKFMKYTKVLDRSGKTMEVVHNNTRKIVQVLRFPERQGDVFDLLTRGMTMKEAEDEYLRQCKDAQRRLDLLAKADPKAHIAVFEEYEVKKIPGGTGWQIEILKPYRMSLAELKKVHTLTEAEEKTLVDQLCQALREGKKAECGHDRIKPENVFVVAENEFALDDFHGETEPALGLLADLVETPALKEQLAAGDVWSWNV